MSKEAKIVCYLNHFFAGVGGEEKADVGVEVRTGAVGPARGLERELSGKGKVVATVFCGDNRFAEAPDEAKQQVLALIRPLQPDVLVAGPAFDAGRYGFACAEVGHAIASALGIPCVLGLYPSNPGVTVYQQYKDEKVYAVPTTDTAVGMAEALKVMARWALRLAAAEPIGHAAAEGYIGRGLRREVQSDRPGAERAVDMLLAKLHGQPFASEIPIVKFDDVVPATPIKDLKSATIALISTSGVVPHGNPDKFKSGSNTFWRKYPIEGVGAMDPSQWETVHGGYHTAFMNQNPHYGVPLDVLREMEDSEAIGKLHAMAYLFPGVGIQPTPARRLGQEIAQDLKQSSVDGALLVST